MKEETRDYTVKARLTKQEYQEFVKRVGKYGTENNMSAYIRSCIFSDDLRHSLAVADEMKNLNYQIRKIGVLINQITIGVNRGILYPGDAKVLVSKMKEIECLVGKFQKWLEEGNEAWRSQN